MLRLETYEWTIVLLQNFLSKQLMKLKCEKTYRILNSVSNDWKI